MQAKQQGMAMDIEKNNQDLQHKERQANLDHALKIREQDQEFVHTQRLHELELAKEHAKGQQQLAHEKVKAEINTKQKKDEGDIKKRTMLAVADPEAANELDNLDAFKEMMDTFKQGLSEVAKSVEDLAKEEEKEEGPKKINIERGKDGRIIGATIN